MVQQSAMKITPTKTDVLFVCYGAGHAEIISPLYFEAKRRDLKPKVLALTTAYKRLQSEGIDCISLDSLLFLFPNKVREIGKSLFDGFPINSNISESESVAYLGLGYWNLIQEHGEIEAKKKYDLLGRKAFEPQLVAKLILQHLNPDICITTSSPRMEEAFVKASKTLNKKCFVVLENFNLPDYKTKFSKIGYGNTIFCPNRKSKETLIQMGRPASETYVTGNPAFEKNSTIQAQELGEAFRSNHLKLKTKSKIIVFAMAPKNSRFYDFDQKLIKQIIKEVNKLSYSVILRPHPTDADLDYSYLGAEVTICSSESIAQLLNACDILITQVSTVGQEAYHIGKPTIHVLSEKFNATHGEHYEGLGTKIVGLENKILSNFDLHGNPKESFTKPSVLIWDKINEEIMNKGKLHE
jgi:predicted glycosyltransferase